MDYEDLRGFSLHNLGDINLVVGKNGCGKSYLLKELHGGLMNKPNVAKLRYITPERGGFLVRDINIDHQMTHDRNFLSNARLQNQGNNFKQQSIALYKSLELLTLREIEREHGLPGYEPKTFQTIIDTINTLLERIKIVRSDDDFQIVSKDDGTGLDAYGISSGESEIISLAIEFLTFSKECDTSKLNFLLIDEPDAHLHPDLQDKLAVFICQYISAPHLIVIIATHSTSFVGALARKNPANIAFMRRGDTRITFADIKESQRRILPMFGAHPLSNIFNEAPIMIVEGDDDVRIWQQAVRSSKGRINVYPCCADTIGRINEFEIEANNIITSIYDDAKGYSLRDRDDAPEEIEDFGKITRMRLACRAAENLMLSDDALKLAQTNWEAITDLIEKFICEATYHPYYKAIKEFHSNGMDRKNADLKDTRMIFAGFITTKPWEVLVGQSIALLTSSEGLAGENSLKGYLGAKICNAFSFR